MTATENKINHIVAITNGSDIYFAESCKTTIRTQLESTNSSFDVYKLDQWALEQYATGI